MDDDNIVTKLQHQLEIALNECHGYRQRLDAAIRFIQESKSSSLSTKGGNSDINVDCEKSKCRKLVSSPDTHYVGDILVLLQQEKDKSNELLDNCNKLEGENVMLKDTISTMNVEHETLIKSTMKLESAHMELEQHHNHMIGEVSLLRSTIKQMEIDKVELKIAYENRIVQIEERYDDSSRIEQIRQLSQANVLISSLEQETEMLRHKKTELEARIIELESGMKSKNTETNLKSEQTLSNQIVEARRQSLTLLEHIEQLNGEEDTLDEYSQSEESNDDNNSHDADLHFPLEPRKSSLSITKDTIDTETCTNKESLQKHNNVKRLSKSGSQLRQKHNRQMSSWGMRRADLLYDFLIPRFLIGTLNQSEFLDIITHLRGKDLNVAIEQLYRLLELYR